MSFITCNLLGPSATHHGLGNQLFGVAATLSHAHDTEKKAYFPCLKNKDRYGRYTENIFRKLNLDEPQEQIKNFYQEKNFWFSKIPNLPNLAVEGYFQSEKYFINNENIIRDTFTLPEYLESFLQSKYSLLLGLDNTVSVHIRRGDYLTNFKGCFEILDKEYYEKAFAYFDPNSVFVFFAENLEDFEFCKNTFQLKKCIYIHEEEVLDLFLMSKMKNNIIANSSFSWWGAWLNQNQNKKVVAPQKWFGKENETFKNSDEITIDLIPKNWTRI